MASIEEDMQSRVGGKSGVFGSQDLRRTFRVSMDNVSDNPVTVLRTISGGVAEGSPHPDDAGQVALTFIRGESLTHKLIYVTVEYGLPLVFNLPGRENKGWHFSLNHSLETETVVTDLNGKPVGSGAYVIVPRDPVTGAFDQDKIAKIKTSCNDTLDEKIVYSAMAKVPLPKDDEKKVIHYRYALFRCLESTAKHLHSR